jgi:hypothetical protein
MPIPLFDGVDKPFCNHGFAVDEDVPVFRSLQSRDTPQGGCLAASAGSQKRQHLALFHVDMDVVDRNNFLKRLKRF